MILRKKRIIRLHQAVPCHLGNDAGSRNTLAFGISLYDANLRNVQPRNMNGIHQKERRLYRKLRNRLPHCLIGCLQNVDFVNAVLIRTADTDGYRFLLNHLKQLFPALWRQLFRIIDIEDSAVTGEYDGRSNNRSRKRSPPHFINAADQRVIAVLFFEKAHLFDPFLFPGQPGFPPFRPGLFGLLFFTHPLASSPVFSASALR